MTLVVEGRDVGQVDAGDGQRPTAVQRGQGGRDEGADRGEQDGRVERFGRWVGGTPGTGGPELQGQLPGLGGTGRTWTLAPWASATWAVRWAEPPNP